MIKRRGSLLSLMEYPNSQTWKPDRNIFFREGDFVNSVVAPGVTGVVRKVDDFIHKVYVQWNGGELIQMEPEYLSLVPCVDNKSRERFTPAQSIDVDYNIDETNRGFAKENHGMTWEPDGIYEPANPNLDYKKYMKNQDSAYRDHAYEHSHLDRQENGPSGRRDFKTFYNNVTKGKNVKTIPEVVKQIVKRDTQGTSLGVEPPAEGEDFKGTMEREVGNIIINDKMLGQKRTASKKGRRSNMYLAAEVKKKKYELMHPLTCPPGQVSESRMSMEDEMIVQQVRDDIKDVLSFAPGVNPDVEIEPLSNNAKGGKPHEQIFEKKPGKNSADPEKSEMLKTISKNVFDKIRGLKKK